MSIDPVYKVPSGGTQDLIKGLEYQLKILQLFCLKAYYNKSYNDFYCSSENADGKKFDDVVMEYKIGNTVNAIYLQAKHLIVAKQISFETFFNDEKFHLYKYFTSFQEIKSGIVQNLGFMIKEVILCTNDQVSLASGSKNILFLKSSTFDLTLVFEKIENHEIFGNEGMNLKLLDSNVKLLRDMFIALELVKLLFGKDKDHKFYLLNHLKSFCFQKFLTLVLVPSNLKINF